MYLKFLHSRIQQKVPCKFFTCEMVKTGNFQFIQVNRYIMQYIVCFLLCNKSLQNDSFDIPVPKNNGKSPQILQNKCFPRRLYPYLINDTGNHFCSYSFLKSWSVADEYIVPCYWYSLSFNSQNPFPTPYKRHSKKHSRFEM